MSLPDYPPTAAGRPNRPAARRRTVHRAALAVLVLGMAVTAALTAVSRITYLHQERRLLESHAALTAASVAVEPADIERRLRPAVVAAADARRSVVAFRAAVAGARRSQPSAASVFRPEGVGFFSLSLVRLEGGRRLAVARVGAAPLLHIGSAAARRLFARAESGPGLVVTRLVAGGFQDLGYAMSAAGPSGRFVVYAEDRLPPRDREALSGSSPNAGLDYALYWGRQQRAGDLVETNADELPLAGSTAVVEVPFAGEVLTLVVSPLAPLAGAFARWVAVLIAVGGTSFTLTTAVLVERLVRRRQAAERLAEENLGLFDAQRRISERLQRSLLPAELPARPRLELAARYLPGTAGIEVGGDWYDVLELGEDRLFFSLGDVAGHDLDAAVLMSSLRQAIRAFASESGDPGMVIAKLSRLVDSRRDGRFATMLCGLLDTTSGELRIANAGHPPPLLVVRQEAAFLEVHPGPPIGISPSAYESLTLQLPGAATLLCYSDGLVERRGEPIGAGLQRLAREVPERLRRWSSLDAALEGVLGALVPSGAVDDVAMLALHWLASPPGTRRRGRAGVSSSDASPFTGFESRRRSVQVPQ